MPKAKTHFVCQSCGAQSPKWLGRCMSCEAGNSLVEEPLMRHVANIVELPKLAVPEKEPARIMTGIGELDRVLGGGLVPGSVVLVGGEPGVGKSTLLLEVAHRFAELGGAPALIV